MYPITGEYGDLILELKDRIIDRIENHSIDSNQMKENLKHPFSLECTFNEPIHQIEHSYDIGRLEVIRQVLADIEYLIAYEQEIEKSNNL
jgi:hypothetical protein